MSLGINHLTAPVDIREKVAFAPEQMTAALHELQDIPAINESVIVSTCNRTEIYCDASSDCSEVISHWLTRHHGIVENSLSPYIYHYSEEEVARHLFRVASGLDSMVLGEPHITGTEAIIIGVAKTGIDETIGTGAVARKSGRASRVAPRSRSRRSRPWQQE